MSSWNQNNLVNNGMQLNPYGYPGFQNRTLPVYRAEPIHGKDAAWNFPMGANSEIYLPDADQDWIWWIRTDMNGNRQVRCFNVTLREEQAQTDINDLAARLAAVEEWINGKSNKSNAKRTQQQSAIDGTS